MHFYDALTGEPRHFVEMASGKTRPSTTKDARKNNWLPSVSTVMSVAGDEGIQYYEKEQIIDACWLNPYTCGADVQSWKRKIWLQADAKRNKASDDGSRIHNALENYFKHDYGLEESREFEASDLDIEIVSKVASFLWEKFGNLKWEAEKTFTMNFGGGYGGCVDLHSNGGKGIIIDFKTQATGDVKNFKYYKKYCMQLAAYAFGLGLQKADCYILKISSTHPGVMELKKYSKEEINRSFDAFYYLLKYWHVVNGNGRELNESRI